VVRPSTWFFKGSGRVKLDYDRIEIADASRGEIVLKTHWIETLAAASGTPIRPVHYGFDPVPFIGVDNSAGATTIVIENKGIQ
jgi:hypothetical protein